MDYKSGAASGNLVRAKPQQKPPEPLNRVAGAIRRPEPTCPRPALKSESHKLRSGTEYEIMLLVRAALP